MAAISQLGTELKVGFGTNIYTGYIMEDFTSEATGEQIPIKDENNATGTILVCDAGTRFSFSALIKSTGSLTPPAQGADIVINLVTYRVESSSVKQLRTASVLSVTAIKEDSMSYA